MLFSVHVFESWHLPLVVSYSKDTHVESLLHNSAHFGRLLAAVLQGGLALVQISFLPAQPLLPDTNVRPLVMVAGCDPSEQVLQTSVRSQLDVVCALHVTIGHVYTLVYESQNQPEIVTR